MMGICVGLSQHVDQLLVRLLCISITSSSSRSLMLLSRCAVAVGG